MAIASAFGITTQFENRVIHNFVEEKRNWIELWIQWQWIEHDSDLQLKIVQMTQNSGAHNSTKHHSSQLKLIETISNWRRQEKRDWMGVERGGEALTFDICICLLRHSLRKHYFHIIVYVWRGSFDICLCIKITLIAIAHYIVNIAMKI